MSLVHERILINQFLSEKVAKLQKLVKGGSIVDEFLDPVEELEPILSARHVFRWR